MAEEYKFQRTELLVGTEAMKRIREIRVILFGLGGVGSWCAESHTNTCSIFLKYGRRT